MGSGCSQQAKTIVAENVREDPNTNPMSPKSVDEAKPVGVAQAEATVPTAAHTATPGNPKAAIKIEISADSNAPAPSVAKTPKNAQLAGTSVIENSKSPRSPTNRKGRRRANDTTYTLSKDAIQSKFDVIYGHCSGRMASDYTLDERIPKKLAADKWDDRLDALSQLHSKLSKIKLSGLNEEGLVQTFVNLAALVVHTMNDTVRPVCITSFEVFRKILEVFGSRFRKNPSLCTESTGHGTSIGETLTTSVESLLYRMGDSNAKVRSEAQATMLEVVNLVTPRGMPIVWNVLFADLAIQKDVESDSAILQRLVMMKTLISDAGFSKKDGFTLGATMSVAMPSLAIADQKTRTAAMDLVVAAYAVAGDRVNKHLHGCKPAMVKILQRKFQEHHDTELFGGNNDNNDEKATKKKKGRRRRSATNNSNQSSPGAAQSEDEEDSDDDDDGSSKAIPAPMTDLEEAAELANAVELLTPLPGLGVVLLHKLQSDKWSDRKEGFDQVADWAQSRENEARCAAPVTPLNKREALAAEFAAHCALLQPAIEGSVLPVVLAACQCLRRVIKMYSDTVDWRDGCSGDSAEGGGGSASRRAHYLVPALLDKANGTNQRVAREACKCLLDVAHASHGAGLQVVVPHLKDASTNDRTIGTGGTGGDSTASTPRSSSRMGTPEAAAMAMRPCTAGGSVVRSAPRSTLRAKLVLIKVLLREFGVKGKVAKGADAGGRQAGCGLSAREVMVLTKPGLDDSDAKVRKSGIAVIIELEKLVGLKKVMRHLEGMGVKPALVLKIQLKIDPAAAAAMQEKMRKARSALPPLSGLSGSSSSKGSIRSGGHLAPLGSSSKHNSSLKVLGQKAPLVKPAHRVNPNINIPNIIVASSSQGQGQSQAVARSIDFNSELMDQDEEAFMNSIMGHPSEQAMLVC